MKCFCSYDSTLDEATVKTMMDSTPTSMDTVYNFRKAQNGSRRAPRLWQQIPAKKLLDLQIVEVLNTLARA